MAESEVMSLDLMNSKQKAKEYKATQKDVKSKDLVVKSAALTKLHDVRYYTEGGCLVPLVNSALPKKKTMDVSSMCLDQLIKFLDSKQDAAIIASLQGTIASEGNLAVLKVLSDTFNFREEVKKPKKKKGKNAPSEEEEVVAEDPLFDTLRRTSLKCMYCIARTLHAQPSPQKDLQKAVAAVPELVESLSQIIMWVKKDITSDKTDIRVKAVQDGMYALMLLVFALRHNAEASLKFCKNELLANLRELAAEKKFTLYCIQILEIMSSFKEGVVALSSPENQTLLIELVTAAAKQLTEPTEEVAAGNAKEKGKKEPPKKGAPEVVEDPMDKLDCIAVLPHRSALAAVKLICKVFIACASQQNPAVDVAIAKDFADVVSKTLLSSTGYEIIRSAHQAPLDEDLRDSVDTMCVAVGSLALVNAEIRQAIYSHGALSAVLTVLLTSQTIIAGPPAAAAPAGGKGAPVVEAPPVLTPVELTEQRARLMQLRRVAEKAVLNLVSESLESPLDDALAGHVSHGIHLPVRWTSCFARKSDDATFDAGDATLAVKLVEMLSVASDDDLANRGVRLLAAILHGHHHPVELIESKGLHKALIKPLSQLVQLRGLSLVASEVESDIRAAAASAAEKLGVEAAAQAAEAALSAVTEGVGALALDEAAPASATATVESSEPGDAPSVEPLPLDMLIPTVAETFFLALSVVELFMMTTPDTVNVFTTTERVEMLSDLVRALGPVNNAQATRPSCGVPEKPTEFEAVLHDPRRHSWSTAVPSSYHDCVLVRPLIFDVLAQTAAAAQKHRTYEGELPAAPCEPVPASQSPCEEASLITCKLAADACCAVLLSQSDLCWTPSATGTHLNVYPSASRKLVEAVQNGALSLLRSIANSGARGVAGAIGAIATSGFSFAGAKLADVDVSNVESLNFVEAGKKILQGRCGMRDLLNTIRQVANGEAVDENFSSLAPAGYAWKRPQFFDEVFPTNDVLTVQDKLADNPQLWPFVVFCGAFIGTLANPSTTQVSAAVTLDALSAAVRLPVLQDNSQPVITDAIAAVFLSLGGGVALTGILGRFGNVAENLKPAGAQLAYYIFNRGHLREPFWVEWEIAHREEVVLDPKTGKPIPKKEEKKGKDPKAEKKKDPKAPAEVPSAVPELELNLESTEAFTDPNHGPTRALWVKLLDVFATDLHEHCPASCALISAVQGSLSDLAVFLLEQEAAVNFADGTGHTALMYALLLNDAAVVEKLVARKADFNTIDLGRNPTVNYAILALSAEDIERSFPGHLHGDAQGAPLELLGHPMQLQILLNSTMDFNVASPRGLSPIMMALGLGELSLAIGGYRVHVLNASYNSPHASIEQVRMDVEALMKNGASVNACDKAGMVPLHVAAARGDLKLMETLLSHGAIPNALDSCGFLPLHYLVACCPEEAETGFDLLFKFSSNRHLERMVFNDYRTGVAPEEKDAIELESFLNEAFSEALSPSVIAKKRLSPAEVLHQCTDSNMNMLQLCFSAAVLLAEDPRLRSFIASNKDRRMKLALHIILRAEAENQNAHALLTHRDASTGFTTLHAASLLFQGMTPQIYLTEREKKAKRVRKFVSIEARLLDFFYACADAATYNSTCTVPLPVMGRGEWTVMHPAVFWDNAELVACLLQKGYRVEDTEILHFLAEKCPAASEQLVRTLMDAAVSSPKYRALLNDSGCAPGSSRPLHLAVRARNLNLVRALATCVKVDLNAIDEVSGKTALHEACELGTLNIVQAFIPGADRLDMFAGSNNTAEAGRLRTPLNVALDSLNIHIIQELVFMRKNDVIQQLLQISAPAGTEDESASSEATQAATTLLFAMEKANADLAQRLGLNVPPVVVPAALDSTASGKGSSGSVRGEALGDGDGDERAEPAAEEEQAAAYSAEPASGELDQPASPDGAAPEGAPLADLDVIEQSGIGGRALQDKKKSYAQFLKSNEVLRVLIHLVNGSGIVRENDHFHPYYFAGELVDK